MHCEESVSQSYFENAIKVARGRGLLSASAENDSGREELSLELERLAGSCRVLATMADSRRYDQVSANLQ